jgi:hypothetical protein
MDEDAIRVKVLDDHRLHVWFRDGSEGDVDVAELVGEFRGVFEPLKKLDYFRKVKINREIGTLEWPNGADIDPLMLYSKATGKPIVLNLSRKVKVYA